MNNEEKIKEIIKCNERINLKILKRIRRDTIVQIISSICYAIMIICFGMIIACSIIKVHNFNKKINQYDECVKVNEKEYCRIEDR